jgi:hypothetical protein
MTDVTLEMCIGIMTLAAIIDMEGAGVIIGAMGEEMFIYAILAGHIAEIFISKKSTAAPTRCYPALFLI